METSDLLKTFQVLREQAELLRQQGMLLAKAGRHKAADRLFERAYRLSEIQEGLSLRLG